MLWIVIVVVAGLLLVGGLLTWMILYFRRSHAAETERVMGLLTPELARRGWTYAEREDRFAEVFNELERFGPLDPVLIGWDRRPRAEQAHEVLTGQHRGRPFLAARFLVVDPSDSRGPGQTGYQNVLWIRTPAPRPTLDVRQVLRMESAVNERLGRGDLKVGHPEFDARYEITTEDERFARAVLTPQVVDFLLRHPRPCRGFWIRGAQFEVLDDAFDHRDPRALFPALDYRNDLLDLIPRQVWS